MQHSVLTRRQDNCNHRGTAAVTTEFPAPAHFLCLVQSISLVDIWAIASNLISALSTLPKRRPSITQLRLGHCI
jgi:hypothetical protein